MTTTPYEAIKVSDRVYWVGAVDWPIREFHGYATNRGTSYNAFLVLGEKVALIDTVKKPFLGEMMSRIASVIEPSKIDVIISNHAELDHSGSLPSVIEQVRPERVIASKMGKKALEAHQLTNGQEIEVVPSGTKVSLGDITLTCIETRMLHWPDSMVTYLHEEAILFSQDGFGMHLASSERFADEISPTIMEYEAAKYYANILLPFSPVAKKVLAKLGELDLPYKMIAPDHGPVYRRQEDIDWILGRYATWAEQAFTKKAVVVFDTMWESTATMARAVAEGLISGGAAPVQIMRLGSSHRSDVATELLDAGALVVGSPTINNSIYPTLADILAYIEGLKPRNLVGAAFGSYGWSGEATKRIEESLDKMKIERVQDRLRVKYIPDNDALAQCRDLGKAVAKALADKVETAGKE